jgi:predicted ribosomally synthesized peptide with nif11-like leader
MSVEQARQLIERTAADEEFRERLEAASQEDRRAILEAEGYGDVQLRHMSKALPESNGGELSDEEFAAVAGGGETTNVTISAAASAGGGAASAVISIAIIAAL